MSKWLISASRDGDALERPEITGPYENEQERRAAAKRIYIEYFGAGDVSQDDDKAQWYDLIVFPLDVTTTVGVGIARSTTPRVGVQPYPYPREILARRNREEE